MELYFTFPNWKRKAVSVTGMWDERLVRLLDRYGVKGTFLLSAKDAPLPGDVLPLCGGHEIALLDDGAYPAAEAKKRLEEALSRPVFGYGRAPGADGGFIGAGERDSFLYGMDGRCSGSFTIKDAMREMMRTVACPGDYAGLLKRFSDNPGWGGTLTWFNLGVEEEAFSFEDEAKGLEEALSSIGSNGDFWLAAAADLAAYLLALRRVKTNLAGNRAVNASSFDVYAIWGDSHGTVNPKRIVLRPGEEVDLDAMSGCGEQFCAPRITAATPRPVDGEFLLRFPGWLEKALTFSYDDAPPADRRVVDILNRRGFKGTFNINTHQRPERPQENPGRDKSGFVSSPIALGELKALFSGHEVALHGARHETFSSVPPAVVLEDVYRNREVLEKWLGGIARGFAYPCGEASKTGAGDGILRAVGAEYGRVVENTPVLFSLPSDFFTWRPTTHHNGATTDLAERFIAAKAGKEPLLCYIWGHSWEFEIKGNWDAFIAFADKLAPCRDIWHATNIEIKDYLEAARSLVWTHGGKGAINPTSIPVYGIAGGRQIVIEPERGA